MHIYFSGIGGTAIGPLALIAHKAGFIVSGSDKQHSSYIDYLKKQGISDIQIGQDGSQISNSHAKKPIDWFVHTSALTIENPEAPELLFCKKNNIRVSKRDEFLNHLLEKHDLKLIAIAGTHGKTTTTAMVLWLFKQLGLPVSYSVGAKLSFGEMGEFNSESAYFVYEADEFDRNFLAFSPHTAIITGIDWDHPDIYPTKESYNVAFKQFIGKSKHVILWESDARILGLEASSNFLILDQDSTSIDQKLTLPGHVNRLNAWESASMMHALLGAPLEKLLSLVNRFPGVSRRFERIAPNIYSDYAHTPPKIRGALQLAQEAAGKNVAVIYEGLHNTRQHFIRHDLKHLFDDAKHLYIVPSYLAREDPNLPLLSPIDLRGLLSDKAQKKATASELDDTLLTHIKNHVSSGDLVIALSAGGGGSLDEWLRKNL